MKAAVVTRYGGPEVLEIRDVPAPVPHDNEVLVRVHASSVCYGDRIVRSGPFLLRLLNGGWRRPKAEILGGDLAGTVVAVGKDVRRFAPGDQVFGSRGEKFGAYAEFACVAEDGYLALKPHNVTLAEAATLFVGAACSLYFLRKAKIVAGDRVLVHGASGSLGTFAVQLAKYYGAHVTAVCTSANADLMRSLGADAVVDYTREDFVAAGPVYDVICDVLGKAGFPRGLHALAPGGRYLLVGFPDGVPAIMAALLRGLWAHMRGQAVFLTGPAAPVQADLDFLKGLIEAGKLRTVVSRVFPLRDVAGAHRYADSGHKVGNVVVLVDEQVA
ncbi:MAG TPA: NAD(P)-dependent alcohol dehydrogenase [Vicinamibacterales bacterium]|nr:NAD(P)-dependent alcohol dehydrogenase [Vicinamibacterales bacterium]